MGYKKNDRATVRIEDINHLGFGVGRLDGLVVFVADTVMGDECEITLIKVNKSYAVGRLVRLLRASEHRVPSRCGERACRACPYRCISYADELALKENNVRVAFKKAGLADVEIAPVTRSPRELGYRNKAQYPVSVDKEGAYRIGFFAPKSHRVMEAADCPLSPAIFTEILEVLRAHLEKKCIPVYDETTGEGLVRHIYLRRGEVSGEILLTLVLTDLHLPEEDALVAELTARSPALVGILINQNREDTNVILGDTYRTLWGRDHITDTLAGVSLSLSAPAFYQVNHDAAELLYAKAREEARLTGGELLLDLFCGVGSIGLSMAHEVRELIGVEIVESAVECAKENARRAGIENASFYTADATDTDEILAHAEAERGESIRPDVVILDPPRKGCTEKLLSFVASLAPSRIVYVSCNPETLARDCAILLPLGYSLGKVTPFDLFPMTGHVESLVCLTKQTN